MSGHPDLTDVGWRTSSRSSNGADCVQVAVTDIAQNAQNDIAQDDPAQDR